MNDVLYSVDDAVATIVINRPEAMNSLTSRAKTALLEAVTAASRERAVRAVLLTGTGRAFCAGQDLSEHAANLEAGRGLDDTVRTQYNPIVRTITEMDKPVVAAVNGVAAGAGAALAFACDLRIASEKARFAMAFSGIALAPDSGASWTLQRLVGAGRAAELLLLGEPVGSARALELGIVSQVVPADELDIAARALAVRLAQGPTSAYAATKRALRFASTGSLAEALELEADLQDACARTDDHLNATRAFLAKERPVFQGR
ncbi:enoyl-CoA hydratase-related protein [Streptosporangium sp. NPDC006013]|uniref:enoyl-CoA hydratase-related protein n=1 Tax=Streptosporangium sp. NPDC006013 TaxID=3155596 RepID=UPI0033B038B4